MPRLCSMAHALGRLARCAGYAVRTLRCCASAPQRYAMPTTALRVGVSGIGDAYRALHRPGLPAMAISARNHQRPCSSGPSALGLLPEGEGVGRVACGRAIEGASLRIPAWPSVRDRGPCGRFGSRKVGWVCGTPCGRSPEPARHGEGKLLTARILAATPPICNEDASYLLIQRKCSNSIRGVSPSGCQVLPFASSAARTIRLIRALCRPKWSPMALSLYPPLA